jgi:cyclase
VDTMTFTAQGRHIREIAEKLGGGPVQAIVNTHYHMDHTHGNPAFPAGSRIVSTDRTLAYLHVLDAGYWKGSAGATLPQETFDKELDLHIGGKTIRLIHPGRGHTDGDLVVLFVEDRVLHAGDLFFNDRYPSIDLEAGGSVREWADTLDRVLALDFDHVIPGHGPVSDPEGLRGFQRFMRQLAAVGEEAARDKLSLADTEREARLDADQGYQETRIPFVVHLDRDSVIRRAWEEATGHYERVKLP